MLAIGRLVDEARFLVFRRGVYFAHFEETEHGAVRPLERDRLLEPGGSRHPQRDRQRPRPPIGEAHLVDHTPVVPGAQEARERAVGTGCDQLEIGHGAVIERERWQFSRPPERGPAGLALEHSADQWGAGRPARTRREPWGGCTASTRCSCNPDRAAGGRGPRAPGCNATRPPGSNGRAETP